MLRHAERPPISPEDADFGRGLGLTPFGVSTAFAAGNMLRGCRDASFFASPMVRCQLTAQHFAAGMGFEAPTIHDTEQLGVHGFYYEDSRAVQKLMQAQGYMSFMLEYLRKGTAPHSRPVQQATAELAQWLQQNTTTLLGVYVSHDIFVAAFLTGLNAAKFTADNWVGFLHGAVLFETPDRDWTCSPFIPEFSTENLTAP
ncbi:MAG: histidine phosphatase family protein [Kiritimatiellae bacterium]|nr:histidine phosphatase family protein [Kiritimatiellia bacterium]